MTKKRSMTPKQANEYVKSHGVELPNYQVMLTKPLFVFKKVRSYRAGVRTDYIANLVIPIGAVVNLCNALTYSGDGKKMRADQAYCHSVVTCAIPRGDQSRFADKAVSMYNSDFKYSAGTSKSIGLTNDDFKIVCANQELYYPRDKLVRQAWLACKAVPFKPFNYTRSVCESGIHFFVEAGSAVRYG